ncbi:MAG: 4Fe-4S dicluster domain-containing protein [Dehalococcoidia bacterium]|nr:4Fe-4S dicluster domain-containing protein [Dehalococcoidia bacterium]
MASKKINKKDIAKLLSQWSQEFTVFVPSTEDGVATMAKWNGKDTSFLDWYRNTVIPPKANILPAMEEMFSFQKSKEGYHIELPPTNGHKQLIFGIRPCDAKALAILDMTFKEAYEDPYYLSKRDNMVLIGLGCTNPYDSCFCTSLDISPAESTDVDLMLTDIGDELLIEMVTKAGKELIAKAKGLKEATKADDARAKKAKEAAYQKVSRKIDTEGVGDKLSACFDNQDYWEKAAAKCVSCGICTFLCPTCYCFDINDELVKQQGTRFRSWDSCAFPLYTKMPMENPRLEKWRRVRQKVCHKFEFYSMDFSVIACTGCGRCIRLCPVNWDITQTLNNLPEKTR